MLRPQGRRCLPSLASSMPSFQGGGTIRSMESLQAGECAYACDCDGYANDSGVCNYLVRYYSGSVTVVDGVPHAVFPAYFTEGGPCIDPWRPGAQKNKCLMVCTVVFGVRRGCMVQKVRMSCATRTA
eukprot:COSAG01_NODE_4479_length_4986_cov_2.568242_5_plen_127_part_00